VNPDTQPAIAKQYQVLQYGTAVFTYKGRTELVTTNMEQDLTNGIVRIISDQQRKVYFTSGHGEHDTGSSEPGGYSAVSTALKHEHFAVDTVVLAQQGAVPDDAAVVVVAGPRTDFFPGEMDALTRYLGNNGKLLMEFDPPEKPSDPPLTNLIALAHDWGFDVGNNLIIDASGMGRMMGTDASVPLAVNYPTHPITQGFTLLTGFPVARSVSPVSGGVNGRSPQTFVETGPQSWAETDVKGLVAAGQVTVAFDAAKGDKKGPVSIAAAVSAPSARSSRGDVAGTPVVGARVAVVGDSDFASNSAAAIPGNKDLFLNTIGWLSPRADLISISSNEAGGGAVTRAGKRVVDPTRVIDCLTAGALLLFAFGLVLTAKSADGERWIKGGAVSIGDGALFSFRGRVSRSSFWSVIIPIFLSNIVLGVMGATISIAAQERGPNPGTSSTLVLIVLACLGVVIVAGMWISLATYAKRWHDIGHSGWMSLTLLIPFVGLLIFGYLGFSPGVTGLNKYDV
jgi:uncharacterized membrane protein YhaH (DUF805 family)